MYGPVIVLTLTQCPSDADNIGNKSIISRILNSRCNFFRVKVEIFASFREATGVGFGSFSCKFGTVFETELLAPQMRMESRIELVQGERGICF